MDRLGQSFRAAWKRTSSFHHRRLRLHVEQLEDRRLLSGNALLPDVTYHGGPLLQNVQIENIYYGQPWTTDASLQQTITQTDSFLQYLVTSPYFDFLKQYNINEGTFLNQDDIINQNPTSQTIDDSQIRQIISGEITNHNVAAPGANQLYIFYTAPGVEVTANGQNSDDDFAGYHDFFIATADTPIYYAVIPYPTGGLGNGQLNTFQQETVALSHEVAESVTDPDTQSGWFDPRYGEIADIANGQYGLLNGYDVSALWSQSAGQVVVPGAATPTPSASQVQVSGVQVQAVAGQPFTSIVATITNTPASATTASYTATITWGNGTTSNGTITTDPNGGFDVTGTNTYSQAGSFPISVTVDDQNGNAVGTAHSTAKVAAAPSTVTATGTVLTATAGQQFSGIVATFTDSSASAALGNYSVTINWGDGTTSSGTVTSGANGVFDVAGTHTYAASPVPGPIIPLDGGFFGTELTVGGNQNFIVTVTIQDTAASTTATALSLATVTPPTPIITAEGENIATVSGQSFTGVVATFTDSAAGTAVGDFTATINWGNGTSSVGTVQSDPDGGFEVVGTITYNDANYWFGSVSPLNFADRTFGISVDITDTQTGDQARTTSTATVVPTAQNLLVAAQNITATAGQSFSGVVATFSDTNSSLTASDFTATIKWGDGTTSTGTITVDPIGGFDVSGSHTYTTTSTPESFWGQNSESGAGILPFGPGSGTLPLTVTVSSTVNTDTGVSRASATVSPAPLDVQTTGTLFDAVFGTSFSSTVATFTTPLDVSGWTVTINWGDGSTSSGTIVAGANGVYDINGTHTYGGQFLTPGFVVHGGTSFSGPQPFFVTVTLDDPANDSTATAVSLASVTTAPPKLVATGLNLNLAEGSAFSGTVATFTDSDSAGTSSFKATIFWGDGTISSGTVTANPSGSGFLVGGMHTYQRGGTYTVLVSIRDADGNSAVSLSRVIVGDNTPSSSLNSVALGILQSIECYTDQIVQDYQQFLGRTPGSSEINYWVNLMQSGWTNIQVMAGFLSSQEFFGDAGNSNTAWLDMLYKDVLGRNADLGGENYWLQQLANGTSRNAVALGFESSQEREGDVVQSYYQQYLGRTAGSSELSYWVNQFENGMTNAQIVAGFLSSPAYYQQQNGNASDWLTSVYQNVLSRKPDTNGMNYWLTALGQ